MKTFHVTGFHPSESGALEQTYLTGIYAQRVGGSDLHEFEAFWAHSMGTAMEFNSLERAKCVVKLVLDFGLCESAQVVEGGA